MVALTVGVVGASGFVGTAVVHALAEHRVQAITAPRIRTCSRDAASMHREALGWSGHAALVASFEGLDVIINAAGDPDASSLDEDGLFGANALLPLLLLRAAIAAGVPRLIHVSSAVVQNDKEVLDASEEMHAFSPYSASKVMGEVAIRDLMDGSVSVTRFRPPSVHAPGRRVTSLVAKIASSPLATVAAPGNQPTPQALLVNVASAIASLATCEPPPPPVVNYPWEGLTVQSLMEALGAGRIPRTLPRWLAVCIVRIGKGIGRWHRPTAANARRLELLWLGQRQAPSWLEFTSWTPTVGLEGWQTLTNPSTEDRR